MTTNFNHYSTCTCTVITACTCTVITACIILYKGKGLIDFYVLLYLEQGQNNSIRFAATRAIVERIDHFYELGSSARIGLMVANNGVTKHLDISNNYDGETIQNLIANDDDLNVPIATSAAPGEAILAAVNSLLTSPRTQALKVLFHIDSTSSHSLDDVFNLTRSVMEDGIIYILFCK